MAYTFSLSPIIAMGRPKKSTTCSRCNKTFATRRSLLYHVSNKVCDPKVAAEKQQLRRAIELKRKSTKIQCPDCDQCFSREDNLKAHIRCVHSGPNALIFLCGLCSKNFKSREMLKMHRLAEHGARADGGGNAGVFNRVASAHRRAVEVYRLELPEGVAQVHRAFAIAIPGVRRLIERVLVEKRNARISLTMRVRFVKVTADDLADGEAEVVDRDDGVEGVDVITVPMTSNTVIFRYEHSLCRAARDHLHHGLIFPQVSRGRHCDQDVQAL